ncbi:MAG: IPT/TIG domain-containing protein [Longimicrobiales bacterium]|nr:IPT/TIG domain-containing protein [Longimicrobiales bacterium]
MRRLTKTIVPVAVVLVLGLGAFPQPATSQEGEVHEAPPRLGLLYWVSLEGTLLRANVDGSEMEVLRSGLDGPDGLSLDPVNDRIYWTNMSRGPSGSIQRARLDGTPIEGDPEYLIPKGDIVTGKEIELDLEGGRMYWADRDAPRIQRANLDGSGLETVLSGFKTDDGDVVPVENVVGMALDFENGTFYSSDRYMGIVFRAGLEMPEGDTPDARSDVDIIFQGERDHDRPIDIDIDPENEKIYWTDRGSDAVRRADLDGSDLEVLVDNSKVEMRDAIGMSLDLAAGKMYWSDMTTGVIHRANMDGSKIETVVPPNDHRPLGVEHMVLEPEVGPAEGGQRVGILGSNFVPGQTRVSFGGTPATDVEVVDSNLLLATVPAGSAGRVDLTVRTPSGTATARDVYTYRSR